MKRKIYLFFNFLIFTILFSLSNITSAYADTGEIALGAGVGTLGVNADITIGISSMFNLRAGCNGFSYDNDGTINDIEYDYKIDLLSFPILLDWHPFEDTGFRLSGGALVNLNKINIDATSQLTYEIGEATYSVAQIGKLSGTMDFNTIAPYLGLGWGNALGKDKRWSFACDIGIAYQGDPDIKLKAKGPIANNATFQQNLRKEEKDMEDKTDDYRYYPVIIIGITYKF